jgi:hypothetical protein
MGAQRLAPGTHNTSFAIRRQDGPDYATLGRTGCPFKTPLTPSQPTRAVSTTARSSDLEASLARLGATIAAAERRKVQMSGDG